MLVNSDLKIKVEEKVKETIALIEAKYQFKLSKTIGINFDIKGSRLAGQANLTNCVVRFNPAYLNKYGEEFINDTIPHEIAHIYVWEYYGGRVKGHGKEWKQMMVSIGQPPNRCHHYEPIPGLDGRRHKTKYAYTCLCCGKPAICGPKIHANIQKGISYFTKCCNSKLILGVGNIGRVSYKEAVAIQQGQAPIPTVQATYSKIDKCRELYKAQQHFNYTRKQWIGLFVSQAGCTSSGASTYLQTIKREYA